MLIKFLTTKIREFKDTHPLSIQWCLVKCYLKCYPGEDSEEYVVFIGKFKFESNKWEVLHWIKPPKSINPDSCSISPTYRDIFIVLDEIAMENEIESIDSEPDKSSEQDNSNSTGNPEKDNILKRLEEVEKKLKDNESSPQQIIPYPVYPYNPPYTPVPGQPAPWWPQVWYCEPLTFKTVSYTGDINIHK